MTATHICNQITKLRESIRQYEQQYGRTENSVRLLAVSKTQAIESIQEAIRCGQMDFGENYAQELAEKARVIGQEVVHWHFIGPIQSNKTKMLSETVNWVHTIDRIKIAKRLNEQRPTDLPPLNICLQVNLDEEASKSGISLNKISELAEAVTNMDQLKLRGLMTIPKPQPDFSAQRKTFARLRKAQEKLIAQGFALDTLSMGMTADYEAAIAEGATIIRIGTALFGARR
ncbi:MAG TPA: YggS family pyridoxal phosphate-dependent enzyme [Chromatiales bacterium]|nr:YggS family pyridoxal phosphate-dependent enzyme [Thiotrichales bacterium]HIP68932.1 YggS family pyridoxal phosphate-dependent enzyme [Chromatiales bacterium]